MAKKSKELALIKLELKVHGIKFVEELQFAPPRKFRFDIAIPEHRIAIEYEGVYAKPRFDKKGRATGHSGKSRHLTPSGYIKDCEKYNLAILKGWRVLRYTAETYGCAVPDVLKLLDLDKNISK